MNFKIYLKNSYKRILTSFFLFLALDIFFFFILNNFIIHNGYNAGEKEIITFNYSLYIVISLIIIIIATGIVELIVFVYENRKKNYEHNKSNWN